MTGRQTVDSHTSPASVSDRGLGYVPALDGIRAIAVLAVMLFHFGQGWLPGGYIGVDVFFVLSGFLITTLLVQNVPDRFSARIFWVRRARRLLPALALMLVVVFAYTLTTPALEQSTIRGQGVATIFYVNNWWLLSSGSEYFAALQEPSPLLHTWTLSVEEQWYVVLPLLLLALIGLRRFAWRPLLWLLGLGAGLSLAWTVLLAFNGVSDNRLYLGTDTRAQQLLLGGLLAVLGARSVATGRARTSFVPAAGLLGVLGLVGIGAMFATWSEGQWVVAQLPVAAALSAMLIIGAATPDTAVSRWLSAEPLRRVGLISYGLYLWHWPITVIIGDDDTNAATPVRFLLTFAVAIASYALLEKPIRRGAVNFRWFFVAPLVLLVLALVCTPKASLVAFTRGLPEQAAPAYSGSGTKVFVVGDSVSGSLWQPLMAAPRQDVAVTGSLLLGCPLFDLRFIANDKVVEAPPGVDCSGWEAQWRKDAQRLAPEVGLFVGSSSWQFDVLDNAGQRRSFGSEEYRNEIIRALDDALPDLGSRATVITTVPCTALPSNPINDAKNDRRRTEILNGILRDYAGSRGYQVVDLSTATCGPDNGKFYFDGLHFEPEESLRLWDGLAPQLATADRDGA